MPGLGDTVEHHTDCDEGHTDVYLAVGTDEAAIGKRDDEAQGLPQAVVGERRLGIVAEQETIQGWNGRNGTSLYNNYFFQLEKNTLVRAYDRSYLNMYHVHLIFLHQNSTEQYAILCI